MMMLKIAMMAEMKVDLREDLLSKGVSVWFFVEWRSVPGGPDPDVDVAEEEAAKRREDRCI